MVLVASILSERKNRGPLIVFDQEMLAASWTITFPAQRIAPSGWTNSVLSEYIFIKKRSFTKVVYSRSMAIAAGQPWLPEFQDDE